MTTAWILPGGASFGAIQVGVAQALLDQGAAPDLLIGASIGALNAAWLAQDPTVAGAARLRRILPYELIEDAAVPLTIAATDLANAEPVFLERGDVATALLASSAMPGILPPVRWVDRWLVDGWILGNAPLGRAVLRGADRVFVLPCGGLEPYQPTVRRRPVLTRLGVETDHNHSRALADHGVPRGSAAINQVVIGALVARSVHQEFQAWVPHCDVYLPPAPSVEGLSPYSFAEARGLIDAARELTSGWLPRSRPLTPADLATPRVLTGVFD